ncbi:uroporphyrinogen-III C-methyltransferase [Priestia megaterium]|uniref:uroporphyrinogen-III C-methyltransferase n=1 Tax=Priestia megaterium TaxID=1404 RepID=UPI000BF88821|nr:uroporphyrinogen-III C-methyltransferase [Priestia megaterium]MCM3195875.1 uroporphyrinogen-III C-methyltransferase [Priestia megaterium]PFR91253.1 uroporphyrinogen-III C-methyltransferase [Priestia megaterium]PGY49581.1 uroporphyrinogen-III C-methyltransferase [Priestia megaterium]
MGKVYLVGAGPGDPDLITLKGLKAIQQADVILYDRLVNKDLLEYAKSDADIIYCGKLPNYHTLKQETINNFLVKFAKKGKIVTRLKGGDPFVFGRGGEEAEALVQQGISFEIVPGITSGIAAAAYAGIPVTHREYSASFAFVAGHRKDSEHDAIKWDSLAKGVDTLAIYMGVRNLPYICQQLMKYGKTSATPIALIHWGTCADQRTVTGTLGTIVDIVKEEQIENPSMIIVGEVVNFHDRLNWFEKTGQHYYSFAQEAY